MIKAVTLTKTGNKATTQVTLDKAVFGLTPNQHLLKIAYNRYLDNLRQNNAKTLTRGLVRGGGKKPWRQKGTGRARTGSIRNPIWRGGGVIFGPTGAENYKTRLSKLQIRTALAQALSVKAKQVQIIESFKVSQPKTKLALEIIDKIDFQGDILIVVDEIDSTTELALRNLLGVTMVPYAQLTVWGIINADLILIEKPALNNLTNWLMSPRQKDLK